MDALTTKQREQLSREVQQIASDAHTPLSLTKDQITGAIGGADTWFLTVAAEFAEILPQGLNLSEYQQMNLLKSLVTAHMEAL